MIKKFGFTLAEVLITLGIIGVVAAMTIPTLINQTSGTEFISGFKKAVSVLNQAVTLNVALSGDDFSNLPATSSVAGTDSVYSMFVSRLSVVSTGGNATIGGAFNANGNYVLFLKDGMAITFPTGATNCSAVASANCKIVVDVNGQKGPNKLSLATTTGNTMIYDQFTLDFYNQTVVPKSNAGKYVLYN